MAILQAPDPQKYLNGEYGKNRLLGPNGRPIEDDNAGFQLGHHRTFSALYQTMAKAYYWKYDEALKNSEENALAMRRDSFILGCLQERYLQLAELPFHLEPEDQKSRIQKAISDELTKIIKKTNRWTQFVYQLSEAIWYGRYGNQLNWRSVPVNGQPRLAVVDHRPVNGDKIQFAYDGTPMIMIHHSEAADLMKSGRAKQDDLVIGGRSPMLRLSKPEWRQRFVVHKHICNDADYFDGEMAGGVHGVGLRSMIYWNFWLRDEMLGWAINHLKKIGVGGILVFYYDEGNKEGKAAAEEAAQQAGERYAISMPRPRGSAKDTSHAELLSFNESGVQALTSIIQEYFERHIQRLIIGQELSSSAAATGLGSGVANFQVDCVPVEGSEILTRDGFKSPHEVLVGEEVLAYDVETDQCKWTPLIGKTFYDDCEVSRLHVDGQRPFEAICTPNHSWAMQKPQRPCAWDNPPDGELVTGTRGAGVYKDSPRCLREARDISKNGYERLILAAPETETAESILTPTEAALLGWAVTDGHIRKKRYGTTMTMAICQSKEENLAEIRELAGSVCSREWSGKPFTRTFPNGLTYDCKPQYWWTLPGEAARDLLAKCGYEGKRSLPRIVSRLSPDAREAMLSAFLKAEADANGNFSNKNQHIMDAFDMLCALQGRATGKLQRRELVTPNNNKTLFGKRVKAKRFVGSVAMKLDYAGRADIWCPSTKYGTWVMRQNGRVMITGNTKYRILKFDAANLQDSLNTDFIPVAQKWNFPKANFAVNLVFDLVDPQAEQKLAAVSVVFQTGTKIKKDELLSVAGFSKPEEDDETVDILSLTQAQTEIQVQAQTQVAQAQMEMQAQMQQEQMAQQAQMQGMPGEAGMDPNAQGVEQDPNQFALEQAQAQEQAQGQAQGQAAPQEQAQMQPQDDQSAMLHSGQEAQPGEQQAPQEQPMTQEEVLAQILGQVPESQDQPEESSQEVAPQEDERVYLTLADGQIIPLPEASEEVLAATSTVERPPETGVQYGAVAYESVHAPKGGVTVAGKEYVGGQFIPKAVLAKATPEEKAALAGKKAMQGERVPSLPAAQDSNQTDEMEAAPGMSPGEDTQEPAPRFENTQVGFQELLDPQGPIVPDSQWADLVDVAYNGYGNKAPTRQEALPAVMEAMKKYMRMTPHEYAVAQGKAYQNASEANNPTQQDVINAEACRTIMAFRKRRTRDLRAAKEKKGLPKAVHDATRYAQKRGLNLILKPGLAKRGVRENIITGSLKTLTDKPVGMDKQSLAARKTAHQNFVAQQTAGMQPAAAAKRAEQLEEIETQRLAAKDHIRNAAINVAADAITHLLRWGIAQIPPIMTRKTPVTSQSDNPPVVYFQNEEAPVAYFADSGEMVCIEYEEAQVGEDPVQTVALWIRDRLKAKMRRQGLQVSEVELEKTAWEEALALAPIVVAAIEAKGKSNQPSGKATYAGRPEQLETQGVPDGHVMR